MNREQTIATLVLMGWEPICSDYTGRAGIFNAVLGAGYVTTQRDTADGVNSVKSIGTRRKGEVYTECEWHCVTDWHLDAIAKNRGWIT